MRELYGIEVKVIEATRLGPGSSQRMDPAADPVLAPLAKDLRALPFDSFRMTDIVRRDLQPLEAFTMQYGRPDRNRFIRVKADQRTEGKIKLVVTMENARKRKPEVESRADVSIPEGGTMVWVVDRKGMTLSDAVLLLAISAGKPVGDQPVGQPAPQPIQP
jgi:hypothetical protein